MAAVFALVPVVLGMAFNALGALLDEDDVVRSALFGALGGAVATLILGGGGYAVQRLGWADVASILPFS